MLAIPGYTTFISYSIIMKNPSKNILISLEEGVVSMLDIAAKRELISRTKLIKTIIVERIQNHHDSIQESLKEYDKVLKSMSQNTNDGGSDLPVNQSQDEII